MSHKRNPSSAFAARMAAMKANPELRSRDLPDGSVEFSPAGDGPSVIRTVGFTQVDAAPETRSRPGRSAARTDRTRPVTPARAGFDPTSPTSLQGEIRRLEARGDNRSLREDRNLKAHRVALGQLNAERAQTALAKGAAASERLRARFARDPETIDVARAQPDELRSADLAMLERWDVAPSAGDRVDALLRSDDHSSASELARYMLTTATRSYRSAYAKSIRNERPILSPAEQVAVARAGELAELRAATEAGSFGLAIPADINPVIVETGAEYAAVAGLARNVVTVSDVWKGVSAPASAFTFQPEDAVVADNTPTLAQPSVPIFTARSFIPSSEELAADYPDFLGNFGAELSRGYADVLANKTAVGTGSGEPEGLFHALQGITTSPSHVTVTTKGVIGAVDLRKAWAALPQRFHPNAAWLMHEDVLNQIRNLNAAGAQIDLVTDRQGVALMGRPVITSSYCPDFTGTTGSENFAVLADLQSAYTVAVRMAMTVERVPVVFDQATLRPAFQTGWLAYARVGAGLTNPNAAVLIANT
jgi:HK97 family phage major capsid protein